MNRLNEEEIKVEINEDMKRYKDLQIELNKMNVLNDKYQLLFDELKTENIEEFKNMMEKYKAIGQRLLKMKMKCA